MSGGVDSSVAAALLKEEGFDVIGLTLRLCDNEMHDAAAAAGVLGIAHHTADFRTVFEKQVIDYFCREYRDGRTPNPCIRCNRFIKFGAFWEHARRLGAVRMATGHYARIEANGPGPRCLLRRGVDVHKDQSYFLYALSQTQLCRTLMPLGNLSKEEVRRTADRFCLPVSGREESQDICFIGDGGYGEFLKKRIPGAMEPGPIQNSRGEVIGRHRGLGLYTIGQRRGIGIAAPEPLYVTGIDKASNAIVVGRREESCGNALTATEVNCIAVTEIRSPLRVLARIRYRHTAARATVVPMGKNSVRVLFETPQSAITPGQAVVWYDPDGPDVIGGGIIAGPGT